MTKKFMLYKQNYPASPVSVIRETPCKIKLNNTEITVTEMRTFLYIIKKAIRKHKVIVS